MRVPDGVKLLVFDADGTLRRTLVPGYPCPRAPDQWELLPGVRDRLSGLIREHPEYRLGVASNQDQVGYGHLTREMALRLLRDAITEASGVIPPSAAIQCCCHVLEEGCECRKPAPGMLHSIMRFYGLAPDETLFVGDHVADEEAARRAGTRFMRASEFFAKGEG